MSNGIRINNFSILPPAVKNLLIANCLFFLAKIVFTARGVDLDELFGLHYWEASSFHFWQPITYMFMHADFSHLFFNMFALWMFGASVENTWGGRRFLLYYFITGLGAAATHYLVIYWQIGGDIALLNQFLDAPSLDSFQYLAENCTSERLRAPLLNNLLFLQSHPDTQSLNELISATVQMKDTFLNSYNCIGASGAVFGVLLAFGMLFPNAEIYIYFLIPLKAKWFVLIYGIFELLFGIAGTADGVAHFAHLGGMIFGLLLILYWRSKYRHQQDFYRYQDPDDFA